MGKLPSISILMSILVTVTATAAPVEYHVIILHPSAYHESRAFGMSVSNQVGSGYVLDPPDLRQRALLWSGTAASAISLHPDGWSLSEALGSDGGQQVGWGRSHPLKRIHALLWSGTAGSVVDLHPLKGFIRSCAYGISDGQQVGWGVTNSYYSHALLWSGSAGLVADLHPNNFISSHAYAISGGQQVGSGNITIYLYDTHALLWEGTTGSVVDLNPVGFEYSKAVGICDGQQVGCGWNSDTIYSHALLWEGTAESAIDLHPSGGYRLSEALDVCGGLQVGYAIKDIGHPPEDFKHHAVRWSGTAESVIDLHNFLPAGYWASKARAINASGTIVGDAKIEYDWHACMWIPVPPCTPVSIESLTAYPLVVPLGDAVNFEAIIVDGCGEIDALWDFDDGTVDAQTNVTSPVTTTKTYASVDVYTVVLTISDDKVDVGDIIVVVVYDPTGGFATGAGWIYSPAGAYKPDPSLIGKATFAFISRYQKGATVPTGNTRFIFNTGDLHFHSTSYDWLVVTGSNYARFKGTGTINGSGEYRFMLWAGDDDPDTFRIKIWEEDEDGYETDIYDNGFDQEIMGGQIRIHD